MTTTTGQASGRNGQTVKCLGCGRKLKAKASVAQQRGPRCQAKHVARVDAALASLLTGELAAYTEEQVIKAAELIAENAIIDRGVPAFRIGDQHLYQAVSSDGHLRYTATAESCTCKAGQYGRSCYHRAAALVLDTMASVTASIGAAA